MDIKQKMTQLIREEVRKQIREVEDESPQTIDSSSTVDMVIKRIESGPIMASLQKIKNDTHKAQLIMRFAELIGVPKNKLQIVMSTLRKTAM
jgi:hypothetical protein